MFCPSGCPKAILKGLTLFDEVPGVETRIMASNEMLKNICAPSHSGGSVNSSFLRNR